MAVAAIGLSSTSNSSYKTLFLAGPFNISSPALLYFSTHSLNYYWGMSFFANKRVLSPSTE